MYKDNISLMSRKLVPSKLAQFSDMVGNIICAKCAILSVGTETICDNLRVEKSPIFFDTGD